MGTPIHNLVKKLDGHGGLWVNGISPTLSLPATASVHEVVKRYVESGALDGVKAFTILSSERVKIDASYYEAVLLDTRSGQRIILMQFQENTGWWTKTFEVAEGGRDCKETLRDALIQRMRRRGKVSGKESLESRKAAFTLQDLQTLYEPPERGRDAAIRALELENPQEALPLLKRALKNEDHLAVI